MKVRKAMAALFAVLLTVFCIGCTQQTSSSGEKNLEELTVILDWYPNGTHVFLYEALEKGYYEDEGIKLNIVYPSNANDAISMTAAGQADIGFYYMHDVIVANVEQDVPVVSIGALVQKPLNVMMTIKDISDISQLEGAKVGYSGSSLSETFAKTMLRAAGVDENKVEFIDVGFDLMSSMITGQVDATISGYKSHEVPALEAAGYTVKYFELVDYGVPDYTELLIITSQATAETRTDALAAFLRATEKGYQSAKADPDGALEALLKNQNEENFPLEKDVEEKSVAVIIDAAEKENSPFLSQDGAIWQGNIDWLYSTGIIGRTVSSETMIFDVMK